MMLKIFLQGRRWHFIPLLGILWLTSCDKVNRLRAEMVQTQALIDQERMRTVALDERSKELGMRAPTEGSLRILTLDREKQSEVVEKIEARVIALESSVNALDSAVADLQTEVDLYRSFSN